MTSSLLLGRRAAIPLHRDRGMRWLTSVRQTDFPFSEDQVPMTANGGIDPYPIPWLDKNGSHNQPAGSNLEPSHIYHFKARGPVQHVHEYGHRQ